GDTELSIEVLRANLDGNGNTTDASIIARLTTETGRIACDGFASNAGGRVYVPQFFNVPDSGNCFRSEREAFTSIRKDNGATSVIMPRIDAAEGLGDCDDLDPVAERGLKVTRDGSAVFAAFEGSSSGTGGLWRIRPTPLQ